MVGRKVSEKLQKFAVNRSINFMNSRVISSYKYNASHSHLLPKLGESPGSSGFPRNGTSAFGKVENVETSIFEL